jgi:hypothetical protein
MAKIEVIKNRGKQVLVTTAWTKRVLTITGTTPRSATINRSLGSEAWGVTFTSDRGQVLSLPEVCQSQELALKKAIRFVAHGNTPTAKHFRTLVQSQRNAQNSQETQRTVVLTIAKELGLMLRTKAPQ